jgi:type 1 glutamine amidotransferase
MKKILISLVMLAALSSFGANKKIVFIAGNPSHGPGDHEHRAGCLLFQKCLDKAGGFTSVVYSNGWPKEATAFDGADAVVIYSDGGDGHPAIQKDRLQALGELMKKGIGFGCIHYAVEVPKDKGGKELLAWTGGYFETFYSVNPFWDADYTKFPSHPIANGLKPFKFKDEWYYHMRFPEDMKNVTPILTAVPPDNTRGKPGANDAHGGNPEVQMHKGEAEHLMWAIERPDGGRGFGFTGGHFHKGWGEANMRKAILNAVAWIAKADVPSNGIEVAVTDEDLAQNLDDKGGKPKPKPAVQPKGANAVR